MKIWGGLCGLLFLACCGKAYDINPDFIDNAVYDGYQILYSPGGNYWSNGGMVEDRIVFTKRVSIGSGSYSEYVAGREAPLFMPTNYEFLHQGRLIGYNNANLKFFEAKYEDGTFTVSELTLPQIQELFPGLELVKISEAKDGVLNVQKKRWQTKSFLLVNDTEQDFYHYSFEGRESSAPFKLLLTADSFDEIVFSHFGSRDELFPILRIKVVM